MSKKILVTGGTGYIGSHTVVELLNVGHEVEILDNLFNSKIEVLDKIEQLAGVKPKFHQVDLLDYEGLKSVFTGTHFDSVIHFAGLKAVGESVEKPLEYYENNVGGTINLCPPAPKFHLDTFVPKLILSPTYRKLATFRQEASESLPPSSYLDYKKQNRQSDNQR